MIEPRSDAQLLMEFRRGDEQAKQAIIPIIYERYKRLILKICYGYLKDYDRAGDAFHDVFIKIIENMGQLVNPAVFKSWAMTVTRNYCVDYLRRTSKLGNGESELERMTVSYGARIEDRYIAEIDQKTILNQLQTCVKQLTEVDRMIFKLRWQRLKAAQIKQVMKIEPADVRRSYDRIKSVIETCMGRKGFKTSIEEILRLGELEEHG